MVDKCRIGVSWRAVKTLLPVLVSIPFLTGLSCGDNSAADKKNAQTPLTSPPSRIISFAPSVTEILYELGLGDNIIGVTRFCDYPPEAAQKNRISDYANFNYEMVLRLKPDLAVILREQRDLMTFFNKYAIRYVAADSDSVGGIIESIRTIAAACAVPDRGDSLALRLRRRIDVLLPPSREVMSNAAKVLICAGRDDAGSGAVTKCYAAGASSFYNQLIELSGGVNVLNDVGQAYPAISAEAIVRLDPDVIVDLSSAHLNGTAETVCGDWKSLKTVSAVRRGRVHCLSGDYLTIPGPRFLLTLEQFREIF